MIRFDFETFTNKFINKEDIEQYRNMFPKVKEMLNERSDMMSWYHLDKLFDDSIVNDIIDTASYIKNNCDVFLVLGIGGSYLGASSIIEALQPYFYNSYIKPQIYFVGTSLSPDYYHDLGEMIKDKEIIINVISKSGTTFETALAYKLVKNLMSVRYNEEEIKKRIIVTTDDDSGKLRQEVNEMGYKSFIIPDDIGGRYSVFSPVGLLPIAVSGIDIREIYEGAKKANENIDKQFEYAVIRELMYKKGKVVEAYTVYEPKLCNLTEWLKQLYSESLGKEGKGILPISLINTRDLHSLGQFVQDGHKILFETVINVEKSDHDMEIEDNKLPLSKINNIASNATSQAHYNGEVLNNIISIDNLDAKNIGYLLQFFMISCAMSGFIENINPFNQDGVEDYKKIMKDLLAKNN